MIYPRFEIILLGLLNGPTDVTHDVERAVFKTKRVERTCSLSERSTLSPPRAWLHRQSKRYRQALPYPLRGKKLAPSFSPLPPRRLEEVATLRHALGSDFKIFRRD